VNQKEKILELLEEKGSVDNYALNKIAFRYSARIKDLREEGHNIKARHIKGSKWIFTLIREPVQERLAL
jgi:hypothetical protein